MKASEIYARREKIKDLLYENKEVKVKYLVKMFHVSDETIRNDLTYLEEQGILKRVYGGAKLVEPDKLEPVIQRTTVHYHEKLAIAEKALELLPSDNCSIGLDQGSTISVLASLISKTENKRIFTGSIAAILELLNSNNDIYCLGGKLSFEDMAFHGSLAGEPFPNIQMDICFMGSSGVKNRNGFCTSSFSDAEIKRQFLRKSMTKVVLLDSSKFESTSLLQVAPWSEIDYVITNKDAPKEEIEKIKKVTEVLLV